MSALTLVRHGQASFNTADYDRLSPLGERQAACLAEYWLRQRASFDDVVTGTLTRQRQTERALGAAFTAAGVAWPAATRHPGLDEFPVERVVRKLAPELCLRDREVRRQYRRWARGGEGADEALMKLVMRVCDYWVREDYATPVSPRWPEFRQQVAGVMDTLQARVAAGRRVLAITSGGVISVAVQLVAGEPADLAIERNWMIHNGSLTEFRADEQGMLVLAQRAAVDHLEAELRTLR